MKIVALALGVCLGLARAQEPGPEQLIQRITDEVMTAIQADRELAAGDKDKALKLAEQKVLPYVDFEEATRLAVSRLAAGERGAEAQAGERIPRHDAAALYQCDGRLHRDRAAAAAFARPGARRRGER